MAAIFGRFSKSSEHVLIETQVVAERLSRPIQSDLFLLVLVSQNGSPAAELLRQLGATYTKLFDQLPAVLPESGSSGKQGREMQTMLEESIKLAARYRFNSVELEHMLYIVAREDGFTGNKVLRRANLDPAQILARLSEWMISVSALQNQTAGQPGPEEPELEKYADDLTLLASEGQLDPVIGREHELDQLIHVLLRRRKNNPLLVGEPGVGKTALVDALAQQIANKKVPRSLVGKRVLNLDLSAIVAGTIYRGQFEERLKHILEEVIELGNCILFIDEIHTLTGSGGSEGGFDAANILKPALARGEISLIGATTNEEYRKHIRKDKALDRRFQLIQVAEPTPSESLAMLHGLKKGLEKHHSVSITSPALQAAVELSVRYIYDRFLPDKAIDILDEAATFHADPYIEDPRYAKLQQEINLVSQQKSEIVERASSEDEWELARALSEKETQLLNQLQAQHKANRPSASQKKVTAQDIARVVARRTGIPLAQVSQTIEPLDLKKVLSTLKTHILGQDEPLEQISRALMRTGLGLQPQKQPMGSFLLVGPTGTGKTETARVLAEQIFGDSEALIKVDMSEYMERHTVSNLIGAPAGYVGFEQGGSLTEQVWRRPYSVVLFDEIEKAHPDVYNLLLQILEDGVLTDNTGRQTSFAHTIVMMTSNLGMDTYKQHAKIGFGTSVEDDEKEQEALKEHIQAELKDFFRPELLGRLSATVYYRPLTKPVIEQLIQRRFKQLQQSLKPRKIQIKATPAFFNWAVKQYNSDSGARSIDKIFLHQIEPKLIDAIIDSKSSPILFDAKEENLLIKAISPTLNK